MFVDELDVNPYTGVASAESTFDYVELDLRYRTLPFDPGSPSTVREDAVEEIGKVYSLPLQSVPIANGPPVVYSPDRQSLYLPIQKITSTLIGVTSIPSAAIKACTNHVNTDAIDFTYGGETVTYDEKTLLYCGASSRRTVLSSGLQKYNVTHTFIWSPVHNMYYKPGSSSSDAVSCFVAASNGYVDYKDTGFSVLGV